MRSAAAAALAVVLAGCSLNPKYDRPEAPVAPAWPAASAAAGTAPADLGWRDVFGDPRLQALVELALANNRDLRVAALNVELTRAQYRIQRAELYPQIDGNASASRTHVPKDLSTTGHPVTTNTFTVGAGITAFELDFFGRVRSLSTAALEEYLSTEEARRSAHLALVGEVANQYLAVRANEALEVVAKQTLDLVTASFDLTSKSYAAGRASELDLRTAESQVHASRFNLSVAEQLRARAQNALVLLVGQPLPAGLPPPQPLEAETFLAELPAGVPSEVLQRRPDILAAEHALLSANASIGAARAAFFPSITLTAFGGTASTQLSGLFGSGSASWNFGPRINLPIFSGGALRASLDVAEVRKSIQIARYEGAIQSAFREVADALVSRAALDAQLEAEQARVRAEERRYQLSDLRYRKGVDSYLTLLTAQRDLFAAQVLLIQSQLARLTNLVDLYRALGGGWRERTEPARVSSR